jgi:Zn-dependent peptidase ImmA (M78 family)
MPKRDIGAELFDVTLTRAAALKPYWRVSMAALIRRARDLGKITEDRYRDLFIRMSQLGYRKKEPNPIAGELPTTIPRMIEVYLNDNRFGIGELCDLLCWPQDEFAPKYLPVDGLRLAQ